MPLSSDRHIIDDQFSKKLRQHKAQPSGKVWNRLSGQLHVQEKRNNNGKRLLLLFLLLLLGSGGVWITSNFQPGKKITVAVPAADSRIRAAGEMNAAATVSQSIDQSLKKTTLIATSATDSREEQAGTGVNGAAEKQSNFYEVNSIGEVTGNDVMVERDGNVPFGWTGDNSYVAPLATVNYFSSAVTPSAAKKQEQKVKSYPVISKNPDFYIANAAGFYIGFGETFNTTLIVDRKAFSDKNLKFSPTFGTALMVHGGYNFNNKWGMEGAWVIHSQEGQRYKYLPVNNRTTSLEYNQKHVSFNYMQFPILMRHKVQGWSGVTETPIFVNYSLGVQYGRLITYSIDESKEKVSQQNLFRKNEYALVAGVDYDFLSRKAAFYTLGIRTSLGSDIFVKDTPEYLEFEDPHNFLIGIHGAVSFSLNKIQKAPPALR